jgi:hypothetical protein
MKKSIKDIIFFYSVLIGVIYAPLISLLSSKARGTPLLGPITFFTSDTFYYLSIARHSLGKPFYTADGIFPTNGFHPLWEFVVTKLFGITGVANTHTVQIYLVFILCMTLVASGMVLFGFVIYRMTGNFAISLLAAVPGFYYLIFSPIDLNYNSTWSFINGMESPLSIFFFGLLSHLMINKRIFLKSGLLAVIYSATLLTLIIFSRLDDVFLLIPYLILILLFSNSKRHAVIRLAVSVGIPFIAIAIYLFYNNSYAGSFLPVSGMLKHGNWLLVNLVFFFASFIPLGLINLNGIWSETSMRALQMCIPALFALLWLFYWAKTTRKSYANEEREEAQKEPHRYRPLSALYHSWLKTFSKWATDRESYINDHYERIVVAALAVYVVLKGVYNFIYVYLMGQGHWYYPISIMIFNLMIAILFGGLFKRYLTQNRAMALSAVSVLLVILAANSFINNKLLHNYNSAYYDFWTDSQSINRELKALDPNIKIVEYDDGVMAYFLDIPTMNGFGFTLDHDAYEAQYNGRLLDLAYRRGFRVLGVMSYIQFPPNIKNDSDQIRSVLRTMPGIKLENLDQWAFEFLYKDTNSSAVFIKFKPAY